MEIVLSSPKVANGLYAQRFVGVKEWKYVFAALEKTSFAVKSRISRTVGLYEKYAFTKYVHEILPTPNTIHRGNNYFQPVAKKHFLWIP